ncbi:unnamed protein product, partial [Laminaria digitata]
KTPLDGPFNKNKKLVRYFGSKLWENSKKMKKKTPRGVKKNNIKRVPQPDCSSCHDGQPCEVSLPNSRKPARFLAKKQSYSSFWNQLVGYLHSYFLCYQVVIPGMILVCHICSHR